MKSPRPHHAPPPLSSAPVLFGKMPTRGDFVRRGPQGPALDAVDDWAQRGFAHGRPRAATAELHALVMPSADGQEAFVGAATMSRDRVGRAYPLVAGRAVPLVGADPALLPEWPVRWAGLLDAAAELARAAAGGVDLGALDARLVRLPDLDDASGREARGCARAASGAPAAALWHAIWGESSARRAPAALGALAGTLARARHSGRAAEPVRLPLPATGEPTPGQRAAAVSAWLRVVTRLAGPPTWRTLVWKTVGPPVRVLTDAPHPPVALQPPSLVVLPAAPPGNAFLPTLGGAADRDAVLDLADAPPRALDPAHAALFDTSALSLDAFLRRL